MSVAKPLIYANATALALNGIILALMAVREFPPILGLVLIIAFLAVSVWLSCWAQGKLPKRGRPVSFYSAPTEQIEIL
jgi:hypothetical protein